MADLFGRLTARTLGSPGGLRPASHGPFAPFRPEEEAPADVLLPPSGGATSEGRRADAEHPGYAPPRPPRAGPVAADPRAAPSVPATAPQRRMPRPTANPPAPTPRAASPANGPAPPPAREPALPPSRSAHEGPRPGRRRAPQGPPAAPPGPPPRHTVHRAEAASTAPGSPRLPEAWKDSLLAEPPPGHRRPLPSAGVRPVIRPDARARHRDGPSAGGTTVHVSIGRIEVRGPEGPTPTPEPRPWSEGPVLTIDDYLKRRRGGRQ